eukprot:6239456-Pyramimonas_sp.AAC.1
MSARRTMVGSAKLSSSASVSQGCTPVSLSPMNPRTGRLRLGAAGVYMCASSLLLLLSKGREDKTAA